MNAAPPCGLCSVTLRPLLLAACLMLCGIRAQGEVIIAEFMASNLATLADGDGNYSDWIELQNTGAATVDLAGWYLTNEPTNPTKWVFPANAITTLAPRQRLVVFASGEHLNAANAPIEPYFDAAGSLHSNFKLDADGGYLALILPDGKTIASEFGRGQTAYPPQKPDVSYGLGLVNRQLIGASAPVAALVPTDGSLGQAWTGIGYNPGPGWTQGVTGVGFDTESQYSGLIGTDVQTAMLNHNGTAYLRIPFTVNDLAELKSLALGMQYDDGFIAYLNGVKVVARNNSSSPQTTAILPLVNAACGISWSTGYSVPAQEGGRLEFGALDNAGVPFLARPLLRFDAAPLAEVTAPVESVTLELTVQQQYGEANAGIGRVDLHRVDPAQMAWTNLATAAEKSGNGAPPAGDAGGVAWSAGANLFSTHTGGALASTTVNRFAAAGTVHKWTVTGPAAQQLVDEWRTGNNAGLTLVDSGATGGVDYRSNAFGFNGNGLQRPRLTATFRAPSAAWNANAAADRPDAQALNPEVIDLTGSIGLLQPGVNILAIQGLNSSATNNDFLIAPKLSGFTDVTDMMSPGYLAKATPGTDARAAALSGFVRDTKFTSTDAGFHGRGIYDHPFTVSISTATAGAVIYYSSDGSEPHDGSDGRPVNGTFYTGPISITTTTTLRAAAFKEAFLSTNVDTQTYIFPSDVVAQPANPPGFPQTWGPVNADYEMDPRIVNHAEYAATIRQDLKSLPVISLVLNKADMFGPDGIYSNTEAAGEEWERRVSVEYFDPRQPAREFHIHGGVQILGSSQRTPSIKKHGFRVNFKAKYGASELKFPIYPGTKADVFDNLSLHPGGHDGCAFNTDIPQDNSWPYGQATYARARWLFQSQLDTGNTGVHGDFVHLYINGLYWGQYRLNERPDAAYAAEYFGGRKADYDAVKHRSAVGSVGQPNQYEVIDGDDTAWRAMYSLATGGLANDAQFRAIQQYLEIDPFIDYLIVNMVSGNRDWPDKNWFATRRREAGAGFRFYCWDGEITLGLEDPNADRTGVNGANSPGFIYSKLRANPEFRRLFGDRVQRHLFNGGAMTVASMQARFQNITAAIERSIAPESARWGDATIFHPPPNTVLYTRETHWRPEVSRVMTEIIPQRWSAAVQQFRTAGLLPALAPPAFTQHGGNVPAGFSLSISHSNPNGSIYFTVNGSDPRSYGTGAVAADAAEYTEPVTITSPTRVRARVLSGTAWSAEIDATFYPPQEFSKLIVSEIMYHPADIYSGAEYLELQNTGAAPLDLTGVRFTAGIVFTFPDGMVLAPGARVLVVENRASFEAIYGNGLLIAGQFQPSSLANSGETLQLEDGLGNIIESFAYDDGPPWPAAADGNGYSLVRIAPSLRLDPRLASSWRASVEVNGNAGTSDASTFLGSPSQLLTYALGGDELPFLTSADGEISYSFRRNLAADDVVFTVLVSNDLITWRSGPDDVEWLSSDHNADGTDTLRFRAFPEADRMFFQLQVTKRQ